MNTPLTIHALFQRLKPVLGLEWVSGEQAAAQSIHLPPHVNLNIMVGYLNLVRPNLIQVLGPDETRYLESLGKNSYGDAIQRLFASKPLMIIFAANTPINDSIIQRAETEQLPVFRSQLPSQELVELLRHHVTRLLSHFQTLHGVFMEVMGIGVLITGESGIGKSEVALELISRGHRMVADDAPEFRRAGPGNIRGRCPDLLRDFLEVRGLGVINVRAMYGDQAVIESKRLRLIVHLQIMSDQEIATMNRLNTEQRNREVLGVDIAEVVVPVAPGRDLAIIVEAAVRNHVLLLNGYNATEDFLQRQEQLLRQNENS